jgi:isopenicillin-N epimerase
MLRRSLLALSTAPAWTAFAQSSGPGTPRDEAYWSFLRRQFPLREGLVYLNAANVCPAPLAVLDRHQHFLRDFEADPSFQNRAKFGPLREQARSGAAKFFGVTADEIAFTRNTSEASNLIVHGLQLKPEDEVVVVEDNHPSNLDSWKNQSERLGFKLVVVAASQLVKSPELLAAKVEAAFTPKTKVLAITHLTSTTGLLYPAARLARAAREKGIWMHLDGAQSAGMFPVDLRQIAPDSYATSSHKWLLGPLEAGVLFVASSGQKRVWPSIVSVGYSGEGSSGARRFEAFGQRDDARLAALAATFEFLEMVGMKHMEARIRALTGHLMSRLAGSSKCMVRTSPENALHCGVVKVDLPGTADLRALDQALYERQGMAFSVTASGPMRGIRVSPHVYNSMEQIDAVADAFLKA